MAPHLIPNSKIWMGAQFLSPYSKNFRHKSNIYISEQP